MCVYWLNSQTITDDLISLIGDVPTGMYPIVWFMACLIVIFMLITICNIMIGLFKGR